ncbi:hypothetical protein [Kribbella solani]|uniref:Uncharacterized protein n=1 Tax=Kribbella solani TaxID=236067 RepID=A0A841DV05_9ACTN|nr:hypothetical protein [Kribbella solani]MBB5980107.1 hypothetical protein [Kribbella solani]
MRVLRASSVAEVWLGLAEWLLVARVMAVVVVLPLTGLFVLAGALPELVTPPTVLFLVALTGLLAAATVMWVGLVGVVGL